MARSRGTQPFSGVARRRREGTYSVYYVLAREFGWTPKEVDGLPVNLLRFFLERLEKEKRELERRLRVLK